MSNNQAMLQKTHQIRAVAENSTSPMTRFARERNQHAPKTCLLKFETLEVHFCCMYKPDFIWSDRQGVTGFLYLFPLLGHIVQSRCTPQKRDCYDEKLRTFFGGISWFNHSNYEVRDFTFMRAKSAYVLRCSVVSYPLKANRGAGIENVLKR